MTVVEDFTSEASFQFVFELRKEFFPAFNKAFKLEGWQVVGRTEASLIDPMGKLEPDALLKKDGLIIPIELERWPTGYTIYQANIYTCLATNHNKKYKSDLKTMAISRCRIFAVTAETKEMDLFICGTPHFRALYLPEFPEFVMDVQPADHRAFYYLQHLLDDLKASKFRKMFRDETLHPMEKLFISAWVIYFREDTMPDVVSEIREIIKETYKSEEDFVREGLKAGGPEFVKLLTPDELIGLTPEQIKALTPKQLASLSPEQLAALKPKQLAALTPEQIQSLPPDQLAALSPEQIRSLRPEQVQLLTPDQLVALSPEQVMGLFQNKKFLQKLSKKQREELIQYLLSIENEQENA